MIDKLKNNLEEAENNKLLLDSAYENIKNWLDAEFLPQWALDSIEELVEKEAWSELNDRFYKNLSFGTGGMRSRTLGKIITSAEKGTFENSVLHAAVGTYMLNDFNIIRSTVGLYNYCRKNLEGNQTPKLVIAHDMRYFSRQFCLLTASTWRRLGGEVYIFNGPRSTPQLSFSVRYLGATAGVVITASHNPPYDNGFKVYYKDGGQVVSPHAEGIIKEVNAVNFKEIAKHLKIEEEGIEVLSPSADEAYLDIVLNTVLDKEVIKAQKPKVIFSPLHGTGQVTAIPAMKKCGVDLKVVEEQMPMDPSFPTVDSPNPENGEALSKGMQMADHIGADVVIATDPDADRMGVAVRAKDGNMILLNGNAIGSLLAEYRITKLKQLGWIPMNGTKSAAIIKTFVTTRLQDAIGNHHGLKVINTLTGFKWIGEKLHEYELQLVEKLKVQGLNINYRELNNEERRKLLLEHSTYYIFGGEESYGYLADDHVRDKDANAACVQFCELAAYLKKNNLSFLEYLDQIYTKYGYFSEGILNIKYEGAIGAAKIKYILDSYQSNPPRTMDNIKITSILNFAQDEIFDADNKRIPKEEFYFLYLENGYSYAVRASGTEPKIKFYLFAYEPVTNKDFLPEIKDLAESKLENLKQAIAKDIQMRAESFER